MKIFIIKSTWFVKFIELLGVGKFGWHNAKAVAIFPFIIVRDMKYATPVYLNHEKIHFAQQIETLFVGAFLLKAFEGLYSLIFSNRNYKERYLWYATEQEAYLNQENLDYLKTRKRFAFVKYLFSKKSIQFDKKRGSPYVLVSNYDPTLFKGTAKYYSQYRAGYPAEFFQHLISQFQLNKASTVLDLGCGTGQIALKLASYVENVVCVDPDPEMLAEAKRVAGEIGLKNLTFIQKTAEEIDKSLGEFDLVTIGAAFHWMNRPLVLDKIYDITKPNGGVAIVSSGGVPTWEHNKTEGWEVDRKRIVQKYFGEKRRAGKGTFEHGDDKFEDRLQQSRFSKFDTSQYQQTIDRDIESVLGLLYSTSFARKDFLRDKVEDFEQEMRAAFTKHFPNGSYSEEQTVETLLAWK